MIIDSLLQLSSAQAVTVSAPSTSYIDRTAASDIGVSNDLVLAITCNTTAAAAGAATVQFQVQCDSDPGFATALKTVVETDAIAIAKLTAGMDPIFIKVPVGLDLRYVRLNYNVGTGPLTAGAFSVNVVQGVQKNVSYTDGGTF